jgi:signal transduction histidine kinase
LNILNIMPLLNFTSIRTRLLVVYVGIILLGFSGLTVIAGGQITAGVRADYSQRLENEVRLIAQALTAPVTAYSNGDIDEDELNEALKDYETRVDGKLALFPLNDGPPGGNYGNGGNYGPPPRMSFYNKPELETALRGETVLVERKNDSGDNALCTASPVMVNGKPKVLLQLEVPTYIVQGIVLQRWAGLGLGFGLLTTLALTAALWLSRSIIHPLYQLRESAVRLSQGNLSHRVSSTRKDEIGEVARAFNEMATQVQSMLEEQRAFASNTSHELRTPLTAIRLRTEALRHDTTLDDSTAQRYIAEIDDEIADLSNLVQDLTLLSRFDAGRAELGQDQIDFVRLAANLRQQIAAQAEEKDIVVSLALPAEPVLVNASLSHLTVVFRNLLDNALKYTPPGGKITWTIREAGGSVHHTIRDTGHGIAPQHLPHVYERFYRGDKARSRETPGTGLGLALVKSVVEAYGGQIKIDSEGIGKGTTVSVDWPLSPTSPPKSTPVTKSD